MSVLNKKHISIPKNAAVENDLDFHYLKKKGVEYIEQLGSALWTDFNIHDPGITILEMLSYAITDLGMRIDLPIEDLLTTEDEATNIDKQFFKASEALPTNPVTALDYRKLFIDIEGVKNCWLAKHKKTVYVNCKDNVLSYDPLAFQNLTGKQRKQFNLKGLYDLYVDFKDPKPARMTSVKEKIRARYHAHRNLCEDLINIKKVDEYPVKICADIALQTDADEEMVHALVFKAIETYFSPTPRFYSLQQMIAKGYTTLEIIDGPVLEHGYIDTEELKETHLRSEIRLSDIMNLIMDIPGVLLIKEISMGQCADNVPDENEWVLCLEEYQKPVLCDKSVFNYRKDALPLSINKAQVALYLAELEDTPGKANKGLEIPRGNYLNTAAYTTIQNDFPDVYGINELGLPKRSSVARKAKAKQLKGYLLFFDQVLGSYFKHLSRVSQLLSVNRNLSQTFFTQAIKDIKGIDEIATDYPLHDDDQLTTVLFDKLDNNFQRKNEILDHLLARFAEQFSEYAFLMKTLYGTATDEIILKNKEAFLKDYEKVSKNRGKAFNYYDQLPEDLWDTSNVSGVQKRIARLLGIKNYHRRKLSHSFIEIYPLINADNEEVYRWRIRDLSNKIVLSATEAYPHIPAASRELHFAIIQLIQTRESKVLEAFENGGATPIVADNVQVHQSESGKYSYDIINPAIEDKNDPYRIVAKRFTYYNTREAVRQSILDLIKFLKEDFTEEGMFIVEHMMLRPDVTTTDADPNTFLPLCEDSCSSCEPTDPYSFRVSIVLPGYTMRFSNIDFRNYMEKIIKEELPAHVLAKVCWVGYREGEADTPEDNHLVQFENAYKAYLLKKTSLLREQPEAELMELIKALTGLHNVYPTGRLFDCDDESKDLGDKVILGRTKLGSL